MDARDGAERSHRRTGDSPSPPVALAEVCAASGDDRSASGTDLRHHRLLWCSGGTLQVRIGRRSTLSRSPSAVWLPAGLPFVASAPTGLWTARFVASTCPSDWNRSAVLRLDDVTLPILGHLGEHPTGPGAAELTAAVVEHLSAAFISTASVLTLPRDPRALEVAEALLADPANPWELAGWAAEVGTSERTLRRTFREETGLTFARWRTRVRMQAAMGLLEDGRSVDETARRCGYRSTPSFARAFRAETGSSPSQFAGRDAGGPGRPEQLVWPDPRRGWPLRIDDLHEAAPALDRLRRLDEGDPMFRSAVRGPLLVAAALLVLAACGDGDDADDTAAAEPTSTTGESAETTTTTIEPAETTTTADEAGGGTTRLITDATGREVEVPLDPQRVVAINWPRTGVMLTSLGFQPVGVSGGSPDSWREQMAATLGETEVDLDAIEYLGATPPNYEAIAATDPDLIFSLPGDDEMNDQLSQIAPTVVIETDAWPEALDGERLMAELVGRTEEFDRRLAEYEGRIEAVRAAIGDRIDSLTYTYMDHYLGEENYIYSVDGLGDWFPGPIVFRDLGIAPEPAMLDAVGEEYFLLLSLERLPDVGADLIFVGTENGDSGIGEQTSTFLDTTPAAAADQVFEVDQVAWGYTSLSRLSSVLDDVERLLLDRELLDVVE
ncbi:MAG: helix-turn-helix domain-containing protein [Actinomycetota bacterium]